MVNGYEITRTRNYIFLVSNKLLIKQKFLLRITSLLHTYKKYIQIILILIFTNNNSVSDQSLIILMSITETLNKISDNSYKYIFFLLI